MGVGYGKRGEEGRELVRHSRRLERAGGWRRSRVNIKQLDETDKAVLR